MKKRQIKNLKVLEPQRGSLNLDEKFPNMKVITITKGTGYISYPVSEELQISKKDKVVLAKDGNNYYFAKLPLMSHLQGYQVQKGKGRSKLSFYTGSQVKMEKIEAGTYEIIDDPVFSQGVDWYPVEKID